MSNIAYRLVALILIPCLLLDSVHASPFRPTPRTPLYCDFGPQSLSIFTEHALTQRLVNWPPREQPRHGQNLTVHVFGTATLLLLGAMTSITAAPQRYSAAARQSVNRNARELDNFAAKLSPMLEDYAEMINSEEADDGKKRGEIEGDVFTITHEPLGWQALKILCRDPDTLQTTIKMWAAMKRPTDPILISEFNQDWRTFMTMATARDVERALSKRIPLPKPRLPRELASGSPNPLTWPMFLFYNVWKNINWLFLILAGITSPLFFLAGRSVVRSMRALNYPTWPGLSPGTNPLSLERLLEFTAKRKSPFPPEMVRRLKASRWQTWGTTKEALCETLKMYAGPYKWTHETIRNLFVHAGDGFRDEFVNAWYENPDVLPPEDVEGLQNDQHLVDRGTELKFQRRKLNNEVAQLDFEKELHTQNIVRRREENDAAIKPDSELAEKRRQLDDEDQQWIDEIQLRYDTAQNLLKTVTAQLDPIADAIEEAEWRLGESRRRTKEHSKVLKEHHDRVMEFRAAASKSIDYWGPLAEAYLRNPISLIDQHGVIPAWLNPAVPDPLNMWTMRHKLVRGMTLLYELYQKVAPFDPDQKLQRNQDKLTDLVRQLKKDA